MPTPWEKTLVQGKGAISTNAQASTSIASCSENKRAALMLTEEEMSPELRADFCKIRRFYRLKLNVDRNGSAMQAVTIDKMLERIGRFLWYLRNVKNVDPNLSCCSNPLLVQDFVNHDRNSRSQGHNLQPLHHSIYQHGESAFKFCRQASRGAA